MMNELFVCIKVDREERPDVDQIYMDTVTGLTGHGGWPLTVFCTPDGRPFYGGTYYPPEPRHGMPAFRQVLAGVAQAWRDRRERGRRGAPPRSPRRSRARRARGLRLPGAEAAEQGALRLLQRADTEHGGFGGAPKFPTPTSLDLLLAACDVLPERKAREALDHVVLTCREMARGGLYDHLGGGFHRYSVDARWCVPHFEKMLYDQGQLLRTYTETWRRSGAHDDLLWPVRETAEFLRREMSGAEGGFFASQDADSEGEEGRFYVWTPDSVRAVLGDAAEEFCAAYSVTERGNFEHGTTVLMDRARVPRAQFAAQRDKLLSARGARIAPGTDRKRVTAWNALAISGLARAGSLFGDAAMLADATAAADFLAERLVDANGRLLRIWNEGRAHVLAFLDDHAALLEANLDLYRAGAGERFLARALELAQAVARALLRRGRGRPLPHAVRRRGARAAPAFRPRRRDAALDRPRGAGPPARVGARRPRRPARRRAARAAHARRRARAHARGVSHARARRAVRGERRLACADRGRSGRSRHRRTRRARAPHARSRGRGGDRGAGRARPRTSTRAGSPAAAP